MDDIALAFGELGALAESPGGPVKVSLGGWTAVTEAGTSGPFGIHLVREGTW